MPALRAALRHRVSSAWGTETSVMGTAVYSPSSPKMVDKAASKPGISIESCLAAVFRLARSRMLLATSRKIFALVVFVSRPMRICAASGAASCNLSMASSTAVAAALVRSVWMASRTAVSVAITCGSFCQWSSQVDRAQWPVPLPHAIFVFSTWLTAKSKTVLRFLIALRPVMAARWGLATSSQLGGGVGSGTAVSSSSSSMISSALSARVLYLLIFCPNHAERRGRLCQ